MPINKIKKLVTSLQDTDITELTLEKGDFKLIFRKDASSLARRKKSSDGRNHHEEPALPVSPEKKLVELKSTMVGTFFSSASPNRPPLVVEGDHIIPGQKLGVVEAVKIMKDVIATVQGRIDKVLAQNGHAVEYGQPLFLVDISNNV